MMRALAGAALLLGLAPALAEAPAPAGGAAARVAAVAPRPAIWLLEDDDTKIYLFGTTHIFERGFRWRSQRLDAVIREADELVMEIADEAEVDDETLLRSMVMNKPVPILSRVSEQHRPQLQALIDESGLPPEMWDHLHSWAAGMMAMGVAMMRDMSEEERSAANPLDAAMSGAEVELREEFARAGKPISAVETSAQQMEFFRTLTRPAQQAFLESTLESIADADNADRLGGDQDWASGNVDAIAREMEALHPSLYRPLLTDRNRAWTEWLLRRLERPGTVLFAVGAGHLAGRDSVQSMLQARGLTTRRID